MTYFAGIVACLLVAFDCFTGKHGALGLPEWSWFLVGIGWVYYAFNLTIEWISPRQERTK